MERSRDMVGAEGTLNGVGVLEAASSIALLTPEYAVVLCPIVANR